MIKKTQIDYADSWPVYIYFPSDLYFTLKDKAPKEGYTKRELENDHHVKDYIVSLLEKAEEQEAK